MATRYKVGGYREDPKNKSYKLFDKDKFSYSGPKDKDIDLRKFTSPRHNQGLTNSCVANAVIKGLEIKRIMRFGHDRHVDLSRLDLYWKARSFMSPPETKKDEGTHISLACDALRKLGVCREDVHPFSRDNIFIEPSVMATRESYLNKIQSHFKITTTGDKRLKDIILNLNAGNPVVFGTIIGEEWQHYTKESSQIGIEKEPLGRHAMICIGYLNGFFIIENSWSNSWGYNGFAFVKPEVMASNDTKDLWVIIDGGEAWYERMNKNI